MENESTKFDSPLSRSAIESPDSCTRRQPNITPITNKVKTYLPDSPTRTPPNTPTTEVIETRPHWTNRELNNRPQGEGYQQQSEKFPVNTQPIQEPAFARKSSKNYHKVDWREFLLDKTYSYRYWISYSTTYIRTYFRLKQIQLKRKLRLE